ncbi:hypothetical protein GQ53DRAFT_739552 [Thozetella sp. PMI_491]|nr:hypothetical protein GQ53DRAFT_739552 [Thozetella sp. PMI_491]
MSTVERRRTRTGCLTCRARKIKCDESVVVCDNCSRSSLQCLRSANESLSGSTPGTRRQRIKRSCVACKLAKKRCNGERPQCDRCLEKKNNTDPLLLSVCALATKTIRNRELWDHGCRWARVAQRLVLSEIQDISVDRLMSIVLLYEHAARTGEHRLCFMLSGLASRYTQALSLNLEYDHDVLSTTSVLSPVERESRRRLMWACYIIDTMVACGLNHLQTIDTTTIQIQLPSDDRYFLYKVARRTARVPLCFNAAANRETKISTENQDTDAFLLRLFLIRERILRYINDHTDEEDPWRLTSSLADLEDWKESLPPELQFNLDVIIIRREQSILSALISLHVQYHQINCLLYRCTIPSMLFPARAQTGLSRKASVDFLSDSRRGWFDHACAMSTIFEVALEHSPASMADPAVGLSAYNAIIIKFLYLTNFVPSDERLLVMETILPLANIDLRFLRELHSYHPCVRFPYLAAKHLLEEAKTRITHDPTVTLSESGNLVGVLSFPTDSISLDHRTNPLSTVSQMRRDLPDIHAPDRAAVPLSRDGQSPGEPERLWIWISQPAKT